MEQAHPRIRVHQFLESLATDTHVSRSQAGARLAEKLANRKKLVRQRSNTRYYRTKMLEAKEAEIELVEQAVQCTKLGVKLARQRKNTLRKIKASEKTLETIETGIRQLDQEIQCLELEMAVEEGSSDGEEN